MDTVGIFTGLLMCILASLGHTKEAPINLQRGKTGVVPCPVVDTAINRSAIQAVYWYKDRDLLISMLFQGENNIGPGNDNEKYFLEGFSLGINDVQDKDHGLYRCTLIVNSQSVRGSQNVSIFVVPVMPFPTVQDCPDVDNCSNSCLIHTAPGEVERNLTCQVDGSRPHIDLHWERVWPDGSIEQLQCSHLEIQPMQKPGQEEPLCSSTATLRLSLGHYDNAILRCVATGIATGQKNGSFTTVQIKAGAPIRNPPSQSFLVPAIISPVVIAVLLIILALYYKIKKRWWNSGNADSQPRTLPTVDPCVSAKNPATDFAMQSTSLSFLHESTYVPSDGCVQEANKLHCAESQPVHLTP